jgi:hypothetical protein
LFFRIIQVPRPARKATYRRAGVGLDARSAGRLRAVISQHCSMGYVGKQ